MDQRVSTKYLLQFLPLRDLHLLDKQCDSHTFRSGNKLLAHPAHMEMTLLAEETRSLTDSLALVHFKFDVLMPIINIIMIYNDNITGGAFNLLSRVADDF